MIALLAAAASLFLPPDPSQAPNPLLEAPIQCEIGRDCFIQNYPDAESAVGDAHDYRCGSMTYDGLTSTDFRAPTLAAMRRGVPVIAAQSGIVAAVRDGMEDAPYTAADAEMIKGRECGNGVVVDHPQRWRTLYCHLRKGSVLVKPGDRVTTGQQLGLAGESGQAAFAQLGFEVRYAGQVVDPFRWRRFAACDAETLWSPAAQAKLAYVSPSVINRGFAAGAVNMDAVEGGEIAPPLSTSDALVAYVRAIGLEKDDVLFLLLTDANGAQMRREEPALTHSKAQFLLFAGYKRPQQGWAPGVYRAHFEVRRGGRVVLSEDWTVAL